MGDEMIGIEGRELERRIVGALETAPQVTVAEDFAARVFAKLPARKVVPVRDTQYGRIVMWAAVGVLLLALFAIVMRGAERSVVGVTLEWILCGEFVLLAVGLGMGRRVFR
jgi:hypothetical protein